MALLSKNFNTRCTKIDQNSSSQNPWYLYSTRVSWIKRYKQYWILNIRRKSHTQNYTLKLRKSKHIPIFLCTDYRLSDACGRYQHKVFFSFNVKMLKNFLLFVCQLSLGLSLKTCIQTHYRFFLLQFYFIFFYFLSSTIHIQIYI